MNHLGHSEIINKDNYQQNAGETYINDIIDIIRNKGM